MATFVLTVLGDDRPGLVSALSAPISAHGASWQRSQLSRIEGKFAGIVLVTVAADQYEALVAELTALETEGLKVVAERTDVAAAPDTQVITLELLGADRPGILAEVASALAELRVGIEELTTDVREAPMAGGRLFEARAVLSAPTGTSSAQLRTVLEGLADELMVEITLTDE
jgi:glycine cleavage system regulatory protein